MREKRKGQTTSAEKEDPPLYWVDLGSPPFLVGQDQPSCLGCSSAMPACGMADGFQSRTTSGVQIQRNIPPEPALASPIKRHLMVELALASPIKSAQDFESIQPERRSKPPLSTSVPSSPRSVVHQDAGRPQTKLQQDLSLSRHRMATLGYDLEREVLPV